MGSPPSAPSLPVLWPSWPNLEAPSSSSALAPTPSTLTPPFPLLLKKLVPLPTSTRMPPSRPLTPSTRNLSPTCKRNSFPQQHQHEKLNAPTILQSLVKFSALKFKQRTLTFCQCEIVLSSPREKKLIYWF